MSGRFIQGDTILSLDGDWIVDPSLRIGPQPNGEKFIGMRVAGTGDSVTGVALHGESHYGPDALDIDLIPAPDGLNAAKLYGGAELTGLSATGSIDAGGNLIAGATIFSGTDGIRFSSLTPGNPPLTLIPSGAPMVVNLDAEFLGGEDSAFHRARANHTGVQAPTTISGATAGRFIIDNGTTGEWSALTLPNAATAGDLPYANASNALGMLGIGAANRVLTSSGSAPQWSASIVYAALPTGSSGTWDVGSGFAVTITRITHFTNGVTIGAVSSNQGQIVPGGTNGLFIQGRTGSTNCMSFANDSGTRVMDILVGTTTVQFAGNIRLTAPTTATTVGAAGAAAALPAQPTGYLVIPIGGVDRKLPYYAT